MTSQVGDVWESHMGVAPGTPTYGTYGTDGESGWERGDLSEADARASNDFIYVVNWPASGFFKVGFCIDSRRFRPYLLRGGRLLTLFGPTHRHASVVESDMHRWLRRTGTKRAFARKADASPYLGKKGAGWTECYIDGPSDLLAQLIAIDELAARRRGA